MTTKRHKFHYSILAPDVAPASKCPIDSFCLNGGECSYYEMIGELVCRLVMPIILITCGNIYVYRKIIGINWL